VSRAGGRGAPVPAPEAQGRRARGQGDFRCLSALVAVPLRGTSAPLGRRPTNLAAARERLGLGGAGSIPHASLSRDRGADRDDLFSVLGAGDQPTVHYAHDPPSTTRSA